jgi:PAS domain S-box-containing protein
LGSSAEPPPPGALDGALLDALFLQSPYSVALYDREGRVAAANGAYERHWGIRVADMPPSLSLFSDAQLLTAGVMPSIRRAYAGEYVVLPPVRDDAQQATGADGRAVWTQGHCCPVRGASGEVTHVAIVHIDVSALVSAENALQALNDELDTEREALDRIIASERAARLRSEQLQSVTSSLSGALTLDQVGAVILQAGVDALGAASGSVYLLNAGGTALELIAAVGLPDDVRSAWASIALDETAPAAAAAQLRHPVLLRSVDECERRYPGVPGLADVSAHPVVVATPLLVDGRGLGVGVLTFQWATPSALDDAADFAFLESLAGQGTLAVERARLYHAEREAHGIAERAVDRIRRVQRLTARLNEAITLEQIADVIFEGALNAVGADAGTLAIVQRGDNDAPVLFRTLRSAGFGEALTNRYRDFPVNPGRPVSDAVLERRIVLVGSAEEWRRSFPHAPEDLSTVGFTAFMALPVIANDRVLAVLTFSFRNERLFDEGAQAFLATIAEQCALALERQRLHELELRQNAENAALLETIEEAFIALDREHRITYVNARAERMLGVALSSLRGRSLYETCPGMAGTAIDEAIRSALVQRKAAQTECFWNALGCWVDARAYPAPDGISLVCQDISARRRAQGAAAFLAEASSLLSASLDYTATLSAVADAAVPRLGDWCLMSIVEDPTSDAWPPRVARVAIAHRDAAQRTMAEEYERLYPTNWNDQSGTAQVLRTRTPLFVPRVTEELLQTVAHDEAQLSMLRALCLGSIIIVPLLARGLTLGLLSLCMSDSNRAYDEADVALAQDLAQRAAIAVDNARLYREAERARADAELANVAKSQFLATMSHELRTPLNAIQGHVQLLELGLHGPVTPAQQDALHRIERAEQHLLGLIDDVLNYARLESGSIEYVIRATLVADVLAEVVPMVEQQFRAKGVALALSIPGTGGHGGAPPSRVLADGDRLGQILLNLLSNALKFTPAGGRVEVTQTDAEAEALVQVRDTGIGIPRDKLEAIFQPFMQVRRQYAPGSGGTGLGLAICRDLARGMNGDVVAENAPGGGALFTIRLPAAPR